MTALRAFHGRCLGFLAQRKPIFLSSFVSSLSHRHFLTEGHRHRRLYSTEPHHGNEANDDGLTQDRWTVWNFVEDEVDSRRGDNDIPSASPVQDSLSEHLGEQRAVDFEGTVAPCVQNNVVENQEALSLNVQRDTGESASVDELFWNRKNDRTHWACEYCGHSELKWYGACRSCNRQGTLKRFIEDRQAINGFQVSEILLQSRRQQRATETMPIQLKDVKRGIDYAKWRISLPGSFGNEVDNVLGGGIVPGSLILVGGDPGVGKSTLLLQIAAAVAEGFGRHGAGPVLYISGEENVGQIGNRADRLEIGAEELFLYASTDIKDILENIQRISPCIAIVDSIQTVMLRDAGGSAGGTAQVKECSTALLHFAKRTNIPIFLAGHVTKTGDIAGPRVLEHIVDVVLYMEGERDSSYRMLRPVKNRFGSTDELGVFEMLGTGLQATRDAVGIFMSEQDHGSDVLAGMAVAAILDKSKPFLIKIQALCLSCPEVGMNVNGVAKGRANMIISVLTKQAGLQLQENALFLNVVNGVMLTDTAADLAIAAAICSSFLESPLPNSIAFVGEIGLGGELRVVPKIEKRVAAVAKFGYVKCVVPKSAEGHVSIGDFGDMKLLYCKNLKEVLNAVFGLD